MTATQELPVRSVDVPVRPFADSVRDAVAKRGTDEDLVRRIIELHDADRRGMAAHVATVEEMGRRTAADCATQSRLAQSALDHLRHATRRGGEQFARAEALAEVVRAVRVRAERADEGAAVPAADLLDMLGSVPGRGSKWRPSILAFTPSLQYRCGTFEAEHAPVSPGRQVPFIGWAMYEEAPDRPPVQHAAFLADGAVRATPDLYYEHGLLLRRLE